MKVLFKALRNSKDLTSVLNFCENNGIETLKLENIRFEGNTGIFNWGGYAAAPPIRHSSFSIGKNLFNYFKLDYPGGPPPRGKTFTHVKMVMNGTLKNNDTEKVIQRVEKLGGIAYWVYHHT